MRGALAVLSILLTGSAAFATEPMAPSDIKATFFNGQSFTASTPGGTKFKMTFTSDGKMTREPFARSGSKDTGTWELMRRAFARPGNTRSPVASLSFRRARTNGQFKKSATTIAITVAVWSK